jgi:N-hydroxyarylamine O-acetyltransferase
MDAAPYCERIGADPATLDAVDLETVATLQRAHVTSVPFETLSITGDPHGPHEGRGVSLDPASLFEKVVERERGGFCFELNGAFAMLLREIGLDLEVLAARMLTDDGARPPANHRTALVRFDRPYLVDVGMGVPTMRRPVPLDGTPVTDEIGLAWRVVESDRPDADYLSQYRWPDEEDWADRYVFRTVPRDRSYFAATCEYLATAPESSFTGTPTCSIATDAGHRKLTPATITRSVGAETESSEVDPAEWHRILCEGFGIELPTAAGETAEPSAPDRGAKG